MLQPPSELTTATISEDPTKTPNLHLELRQHELATICLLHDARLNPEGRPIHPPLTRILACAELLLLGTEQRELLVVMEPGARGTVLTRYQGYEAHEQSIS